jgi:hypothetical protein
MPGDAIAQVGPQLFKHPAPRLHRAGREKFIVRFGGVKGGLGGRFFRPQVFSWWTSIGVAARAIPAAVRSITLIVFTRFILILISLIGCPGLVAVQRL